MNDFEGLFYLSFGFICFSFLGLSLRFLGQKTKKLEAQNYDKNDWNFKEELIIVDIISESHDVKTFRFKRENNKGFTIFSPGQFLSFQIGDDEKCLRSYSISGSCENTSTLQVSVKKIKEGIGSAWFHALKIGDKVQAFPPGGHFTDDHLDKEKTRIYIGGGIGITPLLSMIKTGIDRSRSSKMVLFYGMASVNDLVFHAELTLLSKTYKNFAYFPILSEVSEAWSGDTGYITSDFINSKIKLENNEHFYFCGPPVMTDGIVESLSIAGFLQDQLHSEVFVSPSSIDLNKVKAIDVEVTIDDKTLRYSGKNTILEFLENENIPINFACRSGVCGECKCKLIEGEVDALTDTGLTASEKREGNILTCVSRPKTNLKLEF